MSTVLNEQPPKKKWFRRPRWFHLPRSRAGKFFGAILVAVLLVVLFISISGIRPRIVSQFQPQPTEPVIEPTPGPDAELRAQLAPYAAQIESAAGLYKVHPDILGAIILECGAPKEDYVGVQGQAGVTCVMVSDGPGAFYDCSSGACFIERPVSEMMFNSEYAIKWTALRMARHIAESDGVLSTAFAAYWGGTENATAKAQKTMEYFEILTYDQQVP